MTRFLLFAALTLAACSSPFEGDWEAALDRELTAGEPYRAVAALNAGADAGDIRAMSMLVQAHERGYLRGPNDGTQPYQGKLYFRSLPGQLALAERRLNRALEAGRTSDDPEVLLDVARELGTPGVFVYTHDGSDGLTLEEVETARDIYQRIRHADLPQMGLAGLAREIGDSTAWAGHVQAAAAAGEPHACVMTVYLLGDRPDQSTPAGYARFIDEMESCAASPGGQDWVGDGLQTLASHAEEGNDAARELLDGLRAEGVFERHPRLADFVAS
ncbi:MAG: hypothetical protein AAGK21_16910 [Bacteroidota bacterium]